MAKTVMIVEDNELNMKLFHDLLESKGYDILQTKDGMEALKIARSEKPDLILMDISMPIMSGLEATEAIRKIEKFATTPIIALTAHAMEGDREKCLEAGCTEFATKPVNFKALIQTIENLKNQEAA